MFLVTSNKAILRSLSSIFNVIVFTTLTHHFAFSPFLPLLLHITTTTTAAADVNNDNEEEGEVAREGGGEAYLWTDSRYHNEASLRLDSHHWKLMKQGLPKVPSITKFLADMAVKHYQTFGRPLVVGLDAYVHSAAFAKELKEAFDEASKPMLIHLRVSTGSMTASNHKREAA